jgi:repressor LexA
VVARIGSEVTVKRFNKKRNKIILLPENDEFEPIEVSNNTEDFAIEGIGVGVVRAGC